MLPRPIRLGLLTTGVVLAAAGLFTIGEYWRTRQIREALFAELTPVHVVDCSLERFGSPHDGGYLLCDNLLGTAQSAYSYGINATDDWGCDTAAAIGAAVHQYDCFNTVAPICSAAQTIFHAECVGPKQETIAGRPYDTIAGHIDTNGDRGKRLVVKMDVEGSEWPSLLSAPDEVLSAIDQLVVEFHYLEEASSVDTIRRLNRFFHVAHVHQNNFLCEQGLDPFPGHVVEVLFVNKRIAQADPSIDARGPSPLDARNSIFVPDCQAAPERSELERFVGWLKRKKDELKAMNK